MPADSEEAAALARAIEGSAFSTWKESLSTELESEANVLKTRVHDLQSEFDDASMFIRGDLAWRKQLGVFHDKVNDILHVQMESIVAKLKQNADLLSQSITESFARKDEQAKLVMEWQGKMYEDKLRRTRTSLKKEIDRFTRLEKCLRKEEAFQAKEMYDDLVLQLTSEHATKEASLHALLRELRSSYNAMELGNTQLMDSLKAARAESERMKKMLIKQTSNVGGGSPRKSSVRSPSRFASMSTTAAASSIPDVYVQSLKQSLSTAAQTVDGLKKQVAELTSDKENSLKRARQAEDATSRVNDELARVTQLLSESHSALIASKKATEQMESERTHWKELFAELQFRTGSNDQEIEAAKQLADTTKEYIASLEQQVKRLVRLESCKGVMEGAFAEWLDQDSGQRDIHALHKMLETFFSNCSNAAGDPEGGLEYELGQQERHELEIKLRYEYEKRYGDQLNLRVSHERKRVLARIEMLCASHNKELETSESAATDGVRSTIRQQLKPHFGSNTKISKIPFRVVHKIVSDAYDHLGFSEWSATDLDFLHNQIETLQTQITQQKRNVEDIEKFAQVQGMALAKADLLQQEKEFLLAQLTDKYRELRAAQDALQQPPNESLEPGVSSDSVRFGEVPLTVYGHPQRLELKKLRSRPVSASPCLVSSQLELDGERERDKTTAAQQQSVTQKLQCSKQPRPISSAGPLSQHRIKTPSRQGSERLSRSRASADSPHVKPFLSAKSAFGDTLAEPQQQVEHIRSVLKTELLQLSPPENQLEDGGHLGPDGVRSLLYLPTRCLHKN